jgi:hypothetical protein
MARRLDILQIDAAERRPEKAHAIDELVHVLGVDLQVEAVDVGKALEQDGLALHHRLGGERPQVAQAEHGRAVADDGDQVALGRVIVGGVGVGMDRDPRRIGESQIPLGGQGLGRLNLELARPPAGMQAERLFLGYVGPLAARP